jgi:hypothetical protein
MGIDIQWTRQRLAKLKRQSASGFADTRDVIHAHKIRQLHHMGKLGAKFLDDIMPRSTLKGWGYHVDKNGMKVVWQHTRWNVPVTQDKRTKLNKRTGETVKVQDVIYYLDVGTAGHEPDTSPFMQYIGKYDRAGSGNRVTSDGKLVWRVTFVNGIEPHNFFKQLRSYLLRRGEYRMDFEQAVNAEFEALITGTRRKGLVR